MTMSPEQHVGYLIRSSHPYAYRSGQWARIIAVVPALDRDAWLIEWPDKATDVWAINDPAAEYEFQPSGPERKSWS